MITASDEYLKKLQSEKGDKYEWRIYNSSYGNNADIVHKNLNGGRVPLLADNQSPLVFQCLKCHDQFFMDGCSNCKNNQVRFDMDLNSQGSPTILMCASCGEKHYYWDCPSCGNNNIFSKSEPFINTMPESALPLQESSCF